MASRDDAVPWLVPPRVGAVLAKHHCRVAIVLLTVAMSLGLAVFTQLPVLADESYHVAQIEMFVEGRWELAPSLTTIPGYHAILALVAQLLGRTDVAALRVCSSVLSVAAIVTLFQLSQTAGDDRGGERVLQIVLLPVLFPFLLLVYTDVTALLLVALALLLQEKGHYWLAGLSIIAGLAIRQTTIVWLLFAAVSLWRADRGATTSIVRRSAGYLFGALLFGAFVIWNRGVAVGDGAMHPFPAIFLGNVYFALVTAFVLLLPLHVANWRLIAARLRQPLTVLLLAALAPVFALTLKVDHPYNQPDMSWWLHNRVLAWLTASPWTKLATFASISVTLVSLSVTPLRRREHSLVYPFALLSLAPEWQIEPRYALTALALFLVFRVQRSLRFEWFLIAFLAVCTGVLLMGLTSGSWFV
jgi:alpha-1,2-glucosyltransferase